MCGCIWDRNPSKCRDKQLCWGPRMVALESHTATCGDCWTRGDKRVYERQEYHESDKDREDSKKAISDCESQSNGSDNISDDEDYFSADEFLSLSPYSRPATPQLYYEQNSTICPVSEDNDFDLTRTCDPVDLASMGRDYRARRHKTTSSECPLDGTYSFVSCEEYGDEEPPDEENTGAEDKEDDLYYSIVGLPSRPKGPIKSLEDRSLRLYGSVQETK
ncbi:uncharacterized protein N7500_003569 [Penicillium coprophilum]|uniref:uncharacterized protein n=1 Tax=Penicillium coprophilum TaxID=36646 RepID=UPI00239B4068|nr:uncharacterized protein N7500_003569 [Penicillium coprophilum]KAJ5170786.1 hypothetical protein N7500_003569 [Penicillium coprophilum]